MTLRHFLFTWAFLQNVFLVDAQTVQQNYARLITPSELKQNLSILASDALEGRETGTRGQKMAAAFISYHFQEIGLKPPVDGSYYQPFDLYLNIPGQTYVQTEGATYKNFEEVVYFGNSDSNGEITLPVIFAGKGKTQDYSQLDVSGKAVLIMAADDTDYRSMVSLARGKNAKMVFVVNTRTMEDFRNYAAQYRRYLSKERLSLKKPNINEEKSGFFFVASSVAEKLFHTKTDKLLSYAAGDPQKKLLKKVPSGKVSYKTSVEAKVVRSENVLGYLEGTDKKDELIVVTAHYDHIGKEDHGEGDLINNGADDDGSGTSTVMQLAKVFAQARKDGNGPRRSMLFMTVAGEEEGLLGSEYYTDHPVFPLANTVVDLNIDMVGRRDAQHKTSPPYLYVIGADKLSSELNRISESMNEKYAHLVFDYTYNDPAHPDRLYYRSDHWNFARRNIPIIFYFDGIHEDYHAPSDEVEKIEFDLLADRAKCIFYTAWEIANRDERIMPDAK